MEEERKLQMEREKFNKQLEQEQRKLREKEVSQLEEYFSALFPLMFNFFYQINASLPLNNLIILSTLKIINDLGRSGSYWANYVL